MPTPCRPVDHRIAATAVLFVALLGAARAAEAQARVASAAAASAMPLDAPGFAARIDSVFAPWTGPFVFQIVDVKTGATLFLGQVADPRAK